MPVLSSHSVALAGNFYNSDVDQKFPLGTKGIAEDGRVFRYCQVGGTSTVPGKVYQSAAAIVDHLATTATATAAGATSVVFTPGATGGAANLYAEGFLGVSDSAGVGYSYGVDSHGTITASVAFTLRLRRDDPIQIALTTGSKLGLIHNPYKNVIVMPATTATGTLVGVSTYIITNAQYGWLQTKGLCTVLIAGTPALGAMVMGPGAVVGAAEILTTTNLVVAQLIGRMAQIGVNTKYNFVFLDIGD